jgi:ribosomal-protein-alanine N-acetyltransferase
MPSLVTSTVPVGSLAAQPQPTLTAGSGVLLRPWSLGDAQAVMDAYQDEAIQRWHVRRADSLAETREWIAVWPKRRTVVNIVGVPRIRAGTGPG